MEIMFVCKQFICKLILDVGFNKFPAGMFKICYMTWPATFIISLIISYKAIYAMHFEITLIELLKSVNFGYLHSVLTYGVIIWGLSSRLSMYSKFKKNKIIKQVTILMEGGVI